MEVALMYDHNPVVFFLANDRRNRKKDFKFETKWLLDQECNEVVTEAWHLLSEGSLMFLVHNKLRSTRIKLKQWSHSKHDKLC
ncbi:hypothetical protein REPUB_Repub09cG0075800 [Reevesia pubescens]